MVRVNLIPPGCLTDEHLFAENVELDMLLTFINKYPVGHIPNKYTLGKGHMSFFRDKINFINLRKHRVLKEIGNRKEVNFIFKDELICSEWLPAEEDVKLNKDRIIDRLRNPLKKKNNWHYYGKEITNVEEFIKEKY